MKKHESPEFYFSSSVILLPLAILLLMWLVFYFERKYNIDLLVYGIFPRTFSGLIGVLASPFLHGDIDHLLNNSLAIAVLLAALRFFYRPICYKIVFFGIIFSGILTWTIGRETYHIGGSGLVYVLASFIFFKGLQSKNYRLVALSFAIILVYGGMIWFIFPDVQQGISWESHLSGFFVGMFFTKIFAVTFLQENYKYDWQKPDYDSTKDEFMSYFDACGNFQNNPQVVRTYSYFTSNIDVIYTISKD